MQLQLFEWNNLIESWVYWSEHSLMSYTLYSQDCDRMLAVLD